jgi:hypothetical protein
MATDSREEGVMKFDFGDFQINTQPREGVPLFVIDLKWWAKLSRKYRKKNPLDALISDFMLMAQTASLKSRGPEAYVATLVGSVIVLLWLHSDHCTNNHDDAKCMIPDPKSDTDFTIDPDYPVDLRQIANQVAGAKSFAEDATESWDADRAGSFLLCHIAPVFDAYEHLSQETEDEDTDEDDFNVPKELNV